MSCNVNHKWGKIQNKKNIYILLYLPHGQFHREEAHLQQELFRLDLLTASDSDQAESSLRFLYASAGKNQLSDKIKKTKVVDQLRVLGEEIMFQFVQISSNHGEEALDEINYLNQRNTYHKI